MQSARAGDMRSLIREVLNLNSVNCKSISEAVLSLIIFKSISKYIYFSSWVYKTIQLKVSVIIESSLTQKSYQKTQSKSKITINISNTDCFCHCHSWGGKVKHLKEDSAAAARNKAFCFQRQHQLIARKINFHAIQQQSKGKRLKVTKKRKRKQRHKKTTHVPRPTFCAPLSSQARQRGCLQAK